MKAQNYRETPIAIDEFLVFCYRGQNIDFYRKKLLNYGPQAYRSAWHLLQQAHDLGAIITGSVQNRDDGDDQEPAYIADLLLAHKTVLALPDYVLRPKKTKTGACDFSAVDILSKADLDEQNLVVERVAQKTCLVHKKNRSFVEDVRMMVSSMAVIYHARKNRVPDWGEHGAVLLPAVYDSRGGKPIVPARYDYETLAYDRAFYHAWWMALKTLQNRLSSLVTQFRLDNPLAEFLPWAHGFEQQKIA